MSDFTVSWHSLLASPAYFEAFLFVISIFAGVLGAILGIGGGILIVPTLTLLFGVNIRYAIGASIVSIIATSSGAAAAYVRDRITNIRVALLLEMATTSGALIGVWISSRLQPTFLFLMFSVLLLYSALMMLRSRSQDVGQAQGQGDAWAQRLRLNSSYPDAALKREVVYSVYRVPFAFVVMIIAGIVSALLGIGSGILKVPAMDRAMKLPIKVSAATSNFMIGVTAAASAGAYFMKGDVLAPIAAPVALGVLAGSWTGAGLMQHLPSRRIRQAFVIVLVIVAFQMAWKGLRHASA